MNYSKLCTAFRQLFGETTAEFVRRQRLEFAHGLLRSSDLQVQQIAMQAVTRITGVLPPRLRGSSATHRSKCADPPHQHP